MHGALVVAEFSLALVVLTGAGLLIRTLSHLQSVNPGFNSSHVVTALLTCVAAAAGLALDARRLRRGAPKMLGAAAATWVATFAVSAGALAMVSRG